MYSTQTGLLIYYFKNVLLMSITWKYFNNVKLKTHNFRNN